MSVIDEWLILCRAQVEGSGFQKLNKQIKGTRDSLFSVKNLFHAFVGYDIYSGLKAFGSSLIQSTRDLGAMTSRFYAITKSEKLANEELQWTFDLAQRTAMGLKSTADSYSIFYAATQRGLGTEGARQVFQDWTEVSRVLHLSEYQFERVTYALREMASKGAIYSQDLRMQIGTHVPNAIGLAEKAVNQLGFTGSSWFEDFQKSAKGNQKLINQFIVLFSKFAKETYADAEALKKALEQPDAQIQKLYNNWDKFRLSLAKGQLSKDLVSFLKIINPLLEKIVRHSDEIYNLIKALTVILSILAIDKLVIGLTKTGVKILGIAKAIKQVSGFASKMVVLLQSLGYGSSFIPKIISLISTPAGLVILGIALIGACTLLLDWFLKKFFPNIWIKIHLMLLDIKYFFEDLFASIVNNPIWRKIAKLLSFIKLDTSEERRKNQGKGLHIEKGGKFFLGNNEVPNLLQRLKDATSLENIRLNPISAKLNPVVAKHQIDININGQPIAQTQADKDETINVIKNNADMILNKMVNIVKGAFR